MVLMLAITLSLQAADAGKVEAKQKELAAALKGAKTPEGLNYLADQYLQLADEAQAADLYDAAGKAAEQAGKIAAGTKNAELAERAKQKSAEIKTKSAEFGKARSFLKVLEEKPDDPQANLAVGKYLCFVKGDWKKGLPCLAKGSDEALRKLASKEELLAGGGLQPEVSLEAADEWWPRNRDRALHWYRQAWPKLNPLQKEKVRARFKETYARGKSTDKEVVPAGWSVDLTRAPEQAARVSADEFYAVSGRRSMRLLGGEKYVPVVQPGSGHGGAKECVLTVRILTDGGSGDVHPVMVQFWTPGVNPSTESVAVPGDEPWWHEVRVTLKVPEKTTHGRIFLVPPPAGCRVWIDAASLRTDGGVELVDNGDFEK